MTKANYLLIKHRKEFNYNFSSYSRHIQDAICIIAAYELCNDIEVEQNKKVINSICGERYGEI